MFGFVKNDTLILNTSQYNVSTVSITLLSTYIINFQINCSTLIFVEDVYFYEK